MEKKELLETLAALTARYEQHRHYIEKAKAQAATGKFNNAVIEKVVLDHEIKASDVADEVGPLLPRVRELLAGYAADKQSIEASKSGVDEQIQELELRAAIGELDEAAFERETSDLRANQSSANERIAAVQADWDSLSSALERWAATAGPAGHYSAEEAPAGTSAVEEPVAKEASPEEAPVEKEAQASEASPPDEDGSYTSRTELRDDVSPVFGEVEGDAAQVRVAPVEEEIAIEAGEVGEDAGDAPSADVPFGFEEEILGGDVAGASAGEVEIDLGGEAAAAPAADGGEAPRRALLLYQEGTAEEQIYPFTGDALTIGRGRENDIQIKSDSKVSRYHCKLFRRGNNFYIEDQKSSNGSLVNGELITDRRLFGGEEIIIGETFFRFRIME